MQFRDLPPARAGARCSSAGDAARNQVWTSLVVHGCAAEAEAAIEAGAPRGFCLPSAVCVLIRALRNTET